MKILGGGNYDIEWELMGSNQCEKKRDCVIVSVSSVYEVLIS